MSYRDAEDHSLSDPLCLLLQSSRHQEVNRAISMETSSLFLFCWNPTGSWSGLPYLQKEKKEKKEKNPTYAIQNTDPFSLM